MTEASSCAREAAGIDDRSKALRAREAAGIERARRRPKGGGALLIPGASNHSGKARMVEAAGVEPASESMPQKALQA